jgi:Protein of unknown function (DUF5818)
MDIVTGVVEKKDIGMGAWALVTAEGTTYELLDCPRDLRHVGMKVKATGTINADVMTAAMIGKVFNVTSFEKLD